MKVGDWVIPWGVDPDAPDAEKVYHASVILGRPEHPWQGGKMTWRAKILMELRKGQTLIISERSHLIWRTREEVITQELMK